MKNIKPIHVNDGIRKHVGKNIRLASGVGGDFGSYLGRNIGRYAGNIYGYQKGIREEIPKSRFDRAKKEAKETSNDYEAGEGSWKGRWFGGVKGFVSEITNMDPIPKDNYEQAKQFSKKYGNDFSQRGSAIGARVGSRVTGLPLYYGAKLAQSPYEIGRHAGVNARRGFNAGREGLGYGKYIRSKEMGSDAPTENWLLPKSMQTDKHDDKIIGHGVLKTMRPIAEVTGSAAYSSGYGAGYVSRPSSIFRKGKSKTASSAEGTVKGTAQGARANREKKKKGSIFGHDTIDKDMWAGTGLGSALGAGLGYAGALGRGASIGDDVLAGSITGGILGQYPAVIEAIVNNDLHLYQPKRNFHHGRADAGSLRALGSKIALPTGGSIEGIQNATLVPLGKTAQIKRKFKFGVTKPRNWDATNTPYQQTEDLTQQGAFNDQNQAVWKSRWHAPHASLQNALAYGTGYVYGKGERAYWKRKQGKDFNPITPQEFLQGEYDAAYDKAKRTHRKKNPSPNTRFYRSEEDFNAANAAYEAKRAAQSYSRGSQSEKNRFLEYKKPKSVRANDAVVTGTLLGAAFGADPAKSSLIGGIAGSALALGEMAAAKNVRTIDPYRNFLHGRADYYQEDKPNHNILRKKVRVFQGGGIKSKHADVQLGYLGRSPGRYAHEWISKDNSVYKQIVKRKPEKYGITKPRNFGATNTRWQQVKDPSRLDEATKNQLIKEDSRKAKYYSRWRTPYATALNATAYGIGQATSSIEDVLDGWKDPYNPISPVPEKYRRKRKTRSEINAEILREKQEQAEWELNDYLPRPFQVN